MRLESCLGAALCAVALLVCPLSVLAGEEPLPPAERAAPTRQESLELQLYLFVATSEDSPRVTQRNLASALERAQSLVGLPNSRLTATFLQRLTTNGSTKASGVAVPIVAVASSPSAPMFYNFSMDNVRIDEASQRSAVVSNFHFGLRVPVNITKPGGSVTEYENLGLNTNLVLNEGVPAVVSTMSTGRPNEAFVLVAVVNRVP